MYWYKQAYTHNKNKYFLRALVKTLSKQQTMTKKYIFLIKNKIMSVTNINIDFNVKVLKFA